MRVEALFTIILKQEFAKDLSPPIGFPAWAVLHKQKRDVSWEQEVNSPQMCSLTPNKARAPQRLAGWVVDTVQLGAQLLHPFGERVEASHWPGKLQAFTSLIASMRRALFVIAVVRKMNLYPEESKAPTCATTSRSQAPYTSRAIWSPSRSTAVAGPEHQATDSASVPCSGHDVPRRVVQGSTLFSPQQVVPRSQQRSLPEHHPVTPIPQRPAVTSVLAYLSLCPESAGLRSQRTCSRPGTPPR